MRILHFIPPLVVTAAFTACVSTLPPEEGANRAAVAHLKQASKVTLSAEERAGLYLESAREAYALLGSQTSGESARQVYNKAAADLTILLREADNGRLWNRSQTIASGGASYRLRFRRREAATASGIRPISPPSWRHPRCR